MARSLGSGNAQLVMVAVAVIAFIKGSNAVTTFQVGGPLTWNLGVNYTTWGAGNVYHIGDILHFVYVNSIHSVLEVSEANFASCTITNPIKSYNTGNDLITLDKPQQFFICGTLGHCGLGMQVAFTASAPIIVSPPPAPAVPAATPPLPSKAPPISAPPASHPVVAPPHPTSTPPSILPPKSSAAPTPTALTPAPSVKTSPKTAPAPSHKAPAISPAPTETPTSSPAPAAPTTSPIPATPTLSAPSPSAGATPPLGSANSIRCKAATVLGAVIFSGIYLLL